MPKSLKVKLNSTGVFNTIVTTPTFLSNAFIPFLILSSMSTHPMQHSHLCYVEFILVSVFYWSTLKFFENYYGFSSWFCFLFTVTVLHHKCAFSSGYSCLCAKAWNFFALHFGSRVLVCLSRVLKGFIFFCFCFCVCSVLLHLYWQPHFSTMEL